MKTQIFITRSDKGGRQAIGLTDDLEDSKSRLRSLGDLEYRVIGPTNDIEDIKEVFNNKLSYLSLDVEKLLRLSKAVVLIDNSKTSPATGFLIAQNLLMTNWHVFEEASWAKEAVAKFDYIEDDKNPNDDIDPYESYEIDPKIFFHSNEKLDYAVVGVRGNPGKTWGTIPFPRERLAEPPEKVIIIQHPKGLPKQIVMRNNRVLGYDQQTIRYEADTEKGSSGSPVFDKNLNLVALHRAGRNLAERYKAPLYANEGYLISAIQADFPDQLNHLLFL